MALHKPEYHMLLCNSFRVGGNAQGVCQKKDASELLGYIETECGDRGLDALVSATGCLKVCDHGPVLVVYPQGWWFGGIDSEEKVDEILDALEDGEPAGEMLIA